MMDMQSFSKFLKATQINKYLDEENQREIEAVF